MDTQCGTAKEAGKKREKSEPELKENLHTYGGICKNMHRKNTHVATYNAYHSEIHTLKFQTQCNGHIAPPV